ncbi:MAG: hypothetical protein KKA19_01870, partial [Candidatus Margulisbacteria bacterium]|nr:hypothetical protein [Candidatus Margulisiibacteriota bacterium]
IKKNKLGVLLIDKNNDLLLNAYQVNLTNFKLKLIFRNFTNTNLSWLIAYLCGLPVEPRKCIVKSKSNGNISFRINNNCYRLQTNNTTFQKIIIDPIKTSRFGWIISLRDLEGRLLNNYQLLPYTKEKFKLLSRKGFWFQTIIDHLKNKEIPPQECTVNSDHKGHINFLVNKNIFCLRSKNIGQSYPIHIKPVYTEQYNWVLQLYDNDFQHLTDYIIKHGIKPTVRKCRNDSYKVQTIIDYASGLDIKPLPCSIETDANAMIYFSIKNKTIPIKLFAKNKSQLVDIEPIYTKAYGYILRLKDKKGNFLNDYQVRPTQKCFPRGYELQTIIDYLSGLEIEPKPCSIYTAQNGIINVKINNKFTRFHTNTNKKQLVHLIPKYNKNYGWLIEVWNEDKTELLTTIDRRRL